MQVAVLAGGLGIRLRPVTEKIPKCMAPVGGKPFLFYLLRLLWARGADEIVLCIGYLGEQVEDHFGDGRTLGLNLLYSQENGELLGTGGALKMAQSLLQERFLIVNGDTYTDVDYAAIYGEFNRSGAQALIVASPGGPDARCDIAIDSHLVVTKYDKTNPTGLDYINTGVMGLNREVLADVMPGKSASLETDVFPGLIERRQVRAHITEQRFYDIGSFSGLARFERLLSDEAT